MPGPSTHPRRRQRTRHGHSSREDTPEVDDPQTQATSQPATASELVQQAQDATTESKGSSKSQTPWSKDAFNVRQRARNAYSCISFQHPSHPQAQSIELLWISTTYTLISAYRDAVARIEATLPAPGSGARANKDALSHSRTTSSRFRQALVKEAAFYHSLITRIVTFHRLQDRTAPYLAEVNIPVGPGEDAEDDPSLAPHLSKEELDKKIDIVYKGLICLGDLERYKEQYSDKARKERDGAPAKNGREPAERFNKAIMYYEVARGLQPDKGTAFNQLAVIDGYLGDNFHCTYHYFRALEVRLPFPSGEANSERVSKKVFDKWRSQRHAANAAENGEQPAAAAEKESQEETDVFKRDSSTVVSILFIRAGTSHFNASCSQVAVAFARLSRERKSSSETIVKTTAMAIGSHWQARSGANSSGGEGAERRHVVENSSLIFLMSIFTSLVVVAAEEAEEASAQVNADDSAVVDEDEEVPLAQRITAVLRRSLPSSRIMSRWLKSHIEYVGRSAPASPEVAHSVTSFWSSYKRLMFASAQVFPSAQLPELDQPLEEDRDMRGFAPLRGHRAAASNDEELPPINGEVHPNEEQSMRLADLLVDVKLLMQTDVGLRALSNLDHQASQAVEIQSQAETEDDPVNLAMRASLGADGISVGAASADDDDEVILWGNSTSTPVIPPVSAATTAQGLSQSLTLAPSPGPGDRRPPSSSFGGMDGGGQTIWTMSREESQKGMQRARQRDSGQWDTRASGSGPPGQWESTSRQASGQWDAGVRSRQASGQWEGGSRHASGQWESAPNSARPSGQWDRAWDAPSVHSGSRQASGQWDSAPNSARPSGQWERPTWEGRQWSDPRPPGPPGSTPPVPTPPGITPPPGAPPGFGQQYGYRPGSGQGFAPPGQSFGGQSGFSSGSGQYAGPNQFGGTSGGAPRPPPGLAPPPGLQSGSQSSLQSSLQSGLQSTWSQSPQQPTGGSGSIWGPPAPAGGPQRTDSWNAAQFAQQQQQQQQQRTASGGSAGGGQWSYAQ